MSKYILIKLSLSLAVIVQLLNSQTINAGEGEVRVAAEELVRSSDTGSLYKQVYGAQNMGKKFGNSDELLLKVDRSAITDSTAIDSLKKLGVWNNLQTNSVFDYLDITHKVNFSELSQRIFNTIHYQLYTFPYDSQLDKQRTKININVNKSEAFSWLYTKIFSSRRHYNSYEYNLYTRLVRDPKNPKLHEQQYIYLDYKHNFSHISQETPMCIYSMGYKIFSQNKYRQFFESIQRMNYSNFHIVYVDDNSPKREFEGLLEHLRDTNYSFKHKIQFVHPLMKMGPLANLYFWISKYCNPHDIIVFMDADDYFIGTQTLSILNAKYQNPNTWIAYSRMLEGPVPSKHIMISYTRKMHLPVSRYRKERVGWDFGSLRTFRNELFSKITFDWLIEFHFNEKTSLAKPVFFRSAYDAVLIYGLLEIASDDRICFISDFFYMYSGANSRSFGCYFQHQTVDESKARTKHGFKRLANLEGTPERLDNYELTKKMILDMKTAYEAYRKCWGLPRP